MKLEVGDRVLLYNRDIGIVTEIHRGLRLYPVIVAFYDCNSAYEIDGKFDRLSKGDEPSDVMAVVTGNYLIELLL